MILQNRVTSDVSVSLDQDIPLLELTGRRGLSMGSVNICRKNGLHSLNHLIAFFHEHGSFNMLERCWKKNDEELVHFCLDYIAQMRTSKRKKLETILPIKNESNPIIATPLSQSIDRASALRVSPNEDVSLDALADSSRLSVRAINICRKKGLNRLSQISAFFHKYGSFIKLQNCGKKTDNELISLCVNYVDPREIVIEKENDVPLVVFATRHKLSAQAFNLCKTNGLQTLPLLLTFYSENGSFMGLGQCGEKTENELVALCKIYLPPHKDTLSLINELSPSKRGMLQKHTKYLMSNMSVRSKNGLQDIFGAGDSRDIVEKLCISNLDLKNYRNIGRLTIQEVLDLKKAIRQFALVLSTSPDDLLKLKYVKLVVEEHFKFLLGNIDSQIECVIDLDGKVKLFKLIKLLIDSNRLFNSNEKRIFENFYSESDERERSLKSIGSLVGLTRERMRQIKLAVDKKIKAYFQFVSSFNDDDFADLNIDATNPCIVIDNSMRMKLNRAEEVNSNIAFIAAILGQYLAETHSVFGSEDIVNEKKTPRKNKTFTCRYLISNQFFEQFAFKDFVEDVNSLLEQRITESYSLHYEGYLCQFIRNNCTTLLKDIRAISDTILLNEFNMMANIDGCLVFERNIKRPLYKYIVETLEIKNRLMKVEEIYEAIIGKYPELSSISEQSIRPALQKEKDIFIFIGRASTYGLRKWEAEREELKGGTIRDLVEEHLRESNSPMHISEITKHVNKYRHTTLSNVKGNILAEEKRFRIFGGGFFGMKDRNYDLCKMSYKAVSGIYFTIPMLAKLNGLSLEEIINYYVNKFGYAPIQVRSIIEKKITEGKIELLDDGRLKI
jgi:hypothetical protein